MSMHIRTYILYVCMRAVFLCGLLVYFTIREEECRQRMKQLKKELTRVKKEKEKEVAVSGYLFCDSRSYT